MPFMVGGLVAASGIISAIGGAGQSKANAIAAQMQQEQQNFQGKWQNEAQNRNILRQWEAQYHINKQIEGSASRQLVLGKMYGREAYNNATSEMSKQTRQTNDTFLGAVSGRNISLDSASARALLRQSSEQARKNSQILRQNYGNQMRDLETQYENILSQRNLASPEQVSFIGGKATTVDASSSILATGIASSLFSGAAAGVQTYRTQK